MLNTTINDLCLGCHPKIGKNIHVVGGVTQAGHPLKDRVDPKAKNKQLTCASCHSHHSSDYMLLFRYPAKKPSELCQSCHNYSREPKNK
jgi:predicted CXXCH cytochrome family protein